MKPLLLAPGQLLLGLLLIAGLLFTTAAPIGVADQKTTKPTAAPKNGSGERVTLTPNRAANAFDFETKQMQGIIRLDGDYHGVSRLTDKRSGRQIVDARYSLLNLFRIFSVNLGLGTPRSMKGTVKATADTAQITWSATEGHQAEITARYEVREPNIVDLTITVRSRGVYPGYEILLPSYFDRAMLPYVYLKRRNPEEKPDWVMPIVNDVFRGGVLAFPRDWQAAKRYVDGRWTRSEYNMPTAPFFPVRHYAEPVGVMTDTDRKLAAVLMSHTRHCSGVSSRYHADKKEDRSTDYSAIDLTLFGDDLAPGDERTALVRLALVELDGNLNRALEAYRAFAPSKK